MSVLFAVYSNSLGKNAISLGSGRGFPKNYALICSVQHSSESCGHVGNENNKP